MKQYEYVCDSCGGVQEVDAIDGQPPTEDILCHNCGAVARRNWKASITIPDHMSALKGGDDFTRIRSHMKNAPRPSGKRKVYY